MVDQQSENDRVLDGEVFVDCPSGGCLTRRTILKLTGGAAAASAIPLFPSAGLAQPDTTAIGEMLDVGLTINGQTLALSIDPRLSVLDLLREKLDLTGTKKGCNQGACGACTILVNGQRLNACLALAAMYDGAEILTVEGLAQDDELHPVQAAFIEHDAFQCGYCTPGQIMSGIGCIAEGHTNDRDEIISWMSGNICRCGAYPGIVAAVEQAAAGERT